jgi:hypothetical protein
MSRSRIVYEPTDPKCRGSDLKRPAKDLVEDFMISSRLGHMFDRMAPPFPDGLDRLVGWADHATDGLYSELRRRAPAYAKYFHSSSRWDAATFRFADPTGGSLMFGLMRGKEVGLTLAGVLPPPVPGAKAIVVPASWVDDEPVVGWVRAVLRTAADEERLRGLLARVLADTRLRPWTVLAAFSPAFAGYHGHRFRPTPDLWRCVREPDIAFVEKLVPDLLLYAKHEPVGGQVVVVSP